MGVKSRTNELWLHICTAIFGTGSWLTVNSVYVQLPLLVNRVPEGWNLATYMVLIVQIACISPLIYGCLWNRYNAKLGKHNHIRVLLISAMLILSGIGILLVAFLYDIPSTIGNSQHSVWLFLAIFIMSIPCTTSDLLNLPYIYKFADSSFVTSYFIGMGLSALIPSGLSLIQGSEQAGNATITDGNNDNGPLFSTKTFLFIIFVVILFTLLAFWILVREKDRTMAIDAVRLENVNLERPNEDKILKSPDNCKSPISSRSW